MIEDNEFEELKLEPLAKITMTDRVERKLATFFKERGLEPGDTIPKETEMAEALGVSRNVVREALSRFKMLGMIETKKKKGTVMAHPDILNSLERVINPYILSSTTRKEIFELRLVLEMGISFLVFNRIKEEDYKKLESIVQREAEALSDKDRVKCDLDFHSTLYSIAGNDIFKRFQKLLIPVFDYVLEYEMNLPRKAPHGKITHADLLRILKEGQPLEFQQAMYEHLKPHIERIE